MVFQDKIQNVPFKEWIWRDIENYLLLRCTAVLIIVGFTLFKLLYPYPNFMPPDSIAYIQSAMNNETIGVWAVGYSKFLRLFSCFTNSHLALITFQYLLLQCCLLYFLFTLRYLLAPGKWLFRVLTACSALNPLLPHISNFVSSDALFAAISLLWVTQLLWILNRPKPALLLFHAVTLLLAYMVRYNALFYPVVSVVVIYITQLNISAKLTGIAFIFFLLGIFVGRTAYQYYIETNTVQYSAFGGWLMASNALYGYAQAKVDVPEGIPQRFRQLHVIVNRHMDSIRRMMPRPDRDVGIYYFWDEHSPLVTYLRYPWMLDSTAIFFKHWAKLGPLYGDYGRYLISQHPGLFLKYYIWPNFIRYYVPPTNFLGAYNLGMDVTDPYTVRWFGWKDGKVGTYYKEKVIVVTRYCALLLTIVNFLFAVSFAAFVYLGSFNKVACHSRRVLWLIFIIWIGNMCFSIISAPIELRYQLFPMIITLALVVLLIAFLVHDIRFMVMAASTKTILKPLAEIDSSNTII